MDPHDEMRSRDVNKVTRGKQAPSPTPENGFINQLPHDQPTTVKDIKKHSDSNGNILDYEHEIEKLAEPGTTPIDLRFPTMNQTRHCYARYIEYHKCVQKKGKDTSECQRFAKYYRSICPGEWIERWNDQLEKGIFPGPI